jgi:hypothetical protein
VPELRVVLVAEFGLHEVCPNTASNLPSAVSYFEAIDDLVGEFTQADLDLVIPENVTITYGLNTEARPRPKPVSQRE